MKPATTRGHDSKRVRESDISALSSQNNSVKYSHLCSITPSVLDSSLQSTPRDPRRRQAVRMTLTANRGEGTDEKAEVKILLDDAKDVVNKMLETLATRFPPESVMTISRGLASRSDATSSSSYTGSDYARRSAILSSLAEIADLAALANLDSLPDEHLVTLSGVDRSLLPSILQLDIGDLTRYLEDPELLAAAASLAKVNSNLVKILSTISSTDVKILARLPQYVAQFILSLEPESSSRLLADPQLLDILTKQTDDDIFELIMSLPESKLQSLFRSPETLKRLLSMSSFVINMLTHLHDRTFESVVRDNKQLERMAAFEETHLLCHLGLLEDEDQMRVLANDDDTVAQILRNLGEGKSKTRRALSKRRHSKEYSTRVASKKSSGNHLVSDSDIPIRYVHVDVITEIEKRVPKKETVYTEKLVPKINRVFVEKIQEVPEIRIVEKVVDVETIEYIEKRTPKTVRQEIVREVVKHVPRVEKVQVERVVHVPGDIIDVPNYYPVEQKVYIPHFADREVPTVVAQLLQPVLVEGEEFYSVECTTIDPVLISVDVFIPKIVKTNLGIGGKVEEIHRPVAVPPAHYNTLVMAANPHLDDLHRTDLFTKSIDGTVPILPASEMIELVEPTASDWLDHHKIGRSYVQR